ncbi:MAG: hypothetical protein HRU35_05615 [Rickettsiaceae bacterium]|nr:hypothetical protein [Rickettsiaceae bacterium]
MIVIDPASKGITGTGSSAKKLKNNKQGKFLTGVKTEGSQASEQSIEVADIQSVLFLQEFEQHPEQVALKEFGDKAINLLESLQLALLKNNLTIEYLNNLRNLIKNSPQLNNPELAEIAARINLKIEVELAKLETNI